MTVRVSITHHDAEPPALVAEEFYIGPGGEVSDAPVRATEVPAGATATVHLRSGNVLVLRESDRWER
ncbi:MAG: hypothetical protein ROZ37_01485 [Aromatoleum sp.]|jgi:hypothetical protein|uniref:hypothetical protein n=1 Tax=Aromatoleum sp. TaxID=2307007 RepID=UPI0028954627|nr:hypothetical protein [Aromatoleum sp.]MDT3668986.1 hypothetical protein [Aromatoleum sp.]